VISLSGDGRVLVAGERLLFANKGTSNVTRFWDARTLQPLAPLVRPAVSAPSFPGQMDRGTYVAALSPNAKTLVWSSLVSGYQAVDLTTQRPLWTTRCTLRQVSNGQMPGGAAFSPDGQLLALRNHRRSVWIQKVKSGQYVAAWNTRFPSEAEFEFSPRGRYFASPTGRPPWSGWKKAPRQHGGAIELRRVSDWKIQRVFPLSGIASIAFSPDEKSVLGVANLYAEPHDPKAPGSLIRCFDSATGQVKWQIDSRNSDIARRYRFLMDAAYSPDGRFVAVVSPGAELFLLNAANGQLHRTLRFPFSQVSNSGTPHALAFSPDGKRLFARGSDAVLVWDLEP
jgi:WD40 repeat protein